MSIAQLLADLRSHRIYVRLEGTRLRFTAVGGAMSEELRATVEAQRVAIYQYFLDEMREQCAGGLAAHRLDWPEDAREAFEERAGIIEFEAGHDRETAELMAEISTRRSWTERRESGS